MKIYIRVKFRWLGITFGVTRLAYGVSFSSTAGGFSIGQLKNPTDEEIDKAQKLWDSNGIKIAVVSTI